MKPSLTVDQQVALMSTRNLAIADEAACARFLAANNYYRFSGYARYFQIAPHGGDDDFRPGTTFDEIRGVYEADEALRTALVKPLASAELLLRTHTASAIAHIHGPYGRYLEQRFYTDAVDREPTVDAVLRDITRSRERHVLHFRTAADGAPDFRDLPVWSTIEALSFGTLSRCIERGAGASLADDVATSLGVAKAGFAYRVRTLVYLRNRCAHHSRLWHHSIIDAGPTPNNVRAKAKRKIGQFHPRSVLDAIASLDDLIVRGQAGVPALPHIAGQHRPESVFWQGLASPRTPDDHRV